MAAHFQMHQIAAATVNHYDADAQGNRWATVSLCDEHDGRCTLFVTPQQAEAVADIFNGNSAILAANAALAAQNADLLAFVQEIIDLKPEVISGRNPRDLSGQSDEGDMIAADVLFDLQQDAAKLLPTSKKEAA